MGELHLDLKQITEAYGISKSTVLRWKRIGKFQEEEISELQVGKNTTKYLYSQKAIERLIQESASTKGRAPGRQEEPQQSSTDPQGFLIAIELLRERVEELQLENSELKQEVKLLRETNTTPPGAPNTANAPQHTEAQKDVNNKGKKSVDWYVVSAFAIGILLLVFVYYIETAY